MKDPHLISVDELREAGALDVPKAWRKSLGYDHEGDMFPGLFDDDTQTGKDRSAQSGADDELSVDVDG